jgi:hypothetical protein
VITIKGKEEFKEQLTGVMRVEDGENVEKQIVRVER